MFFLIESDWKPAETMMTEEIYHQPSQVSECRAVGWRCKMAGTTMPASLGSQCVTLRIQRICIDSQFKCISIEQFSSAHVSTTHLSYLHLNFYFFFKH